LFVIVVLAGLSVALCAQAGDPTAPTAAQDPATIDRTWQKASAKYDAARTAILKDVDRVNAGGRFRADWESLQSYKVPDWYWDANSGIFFTSPVRSMRAMAKLKFRISRTHTLGEP
jgi:hypothetical protein